jgi:gluconolactonase
MKIKICRVELLALLAIAVFVHPANSADDYSLGADSQVKPGVPAGEVINLTFDQSKVFPGTTRDVQIYVPKQYDPAKPAALMLFQDGKGYASRQGAWRVPTVFDNLIHEGAMPVTIGVFVTPGVVPSGSADAQDRFNRSLEYDAVSDRYSRFIVDEILPLITSQYSISDDPNLRAIGGSSSGAIAAFGVAWHRPDQFRRVFSTIGTYVGLRDGDSYVTMIRKSEPKPLKVFFQDGSNDLNIYGGDWWIANQDMLSALKFSGYDVEHRWGDGGHNGKHGGSIFPEAMRWLWKDSDTPIEVTIPKGHKLSDILVKGESWQLISEGHGFAEGPAVSPSGDVYFTSVPNGEIWKVNAQGNAAKSFDNLPGVSGLMFDAKGNLYAALSRAQQIVRIDPQGQRSVLAENVTCNDLVVIPQGLYFTDPKNMQILFLPFAKADADNAALIPRVVSKRENEDAIEGPNGLITTPDNRFLLVVDSKGHYVWSYRIANDGSLEYGQPYHFVHAPVDEMRTGGDGATMTEKGMLYVASLMGVQVFDQPGRCNGIIAPPDSDRVTNVVFAGQKMNELYATTSGGKVYRRMTAAKGIAPWMPPTKPEKPGL